MMNDDDEILEGKALRCTNLHLLSRRESEEIVSQLPARERRSEDEGRRES
jgi:hypothetical protein